MEYFSEICVSLVYLEAIPIDYMRVLNYSALKIVTGPYASDCKPYSPPSETKKKADIR